MILLPTSQQILERLGCFLEIEGCTCTVAEYSRRAVVAADHHETDLAVEHEETGIVTIGNTRQGTCQRQVSATGNLSKLTRHEVLRQLSGSLLVHLTSYSQQQTEQPEARCK